MKLKIISIKNEKKSEIEMPSQFKEAVRPDLIKRAVVTIQSSKQQKYGASERAGLDASAEISRRRRKYRGSYGHGISRVPRKILTRRGTRFNWVGAVAPGTVGGRRAHPPKSSKELSKKINKKERRKAIRSALSATLDKELVSLRNKVPENYPFIVEANIENMKKTKEIVDVLEKIGLKEELERISVKKIRAGKGKSRGRKYKTKVGPLIVVSKECDLTKFGKNISGVEVVEVKSLNAEILAPGGIPGRLTLFTDSAVEEIKNKKLFTNDILVEKIVKVKNKKEDKTKNKVPLEKKEDNKTKKIEEPKVKNVPSGDEK